MRAGRQAGKRTCAHAVHLSKFIVYSFNLRWRARQGRMEKELLIAYLNKVILVNPSVKCEWQGQKSRREWNEQWKENWQEKDIEKKCKRTHLHSRLVDSCAYTEPPCSPLSLFSHPHSRSHSPLLPIHVCCILETTSCRLFLTSQSKTRQSPTLHLRANWSMDPSL